MDLVPALFSASGIAGVTVLAVANIDDPSPELNARPGVTDGAECTVYQAVVGANTYTTYRFDSASSATVQTPFVIAASGSGQWIAEAGRYCNSGFNALSTVRSGSNTTLGALAVNGPAGTDRELNIATAGLNRWRFRVTSASESGSDAGSDFALLARTDAGGALDTPLSITRAAGGAFAVTRPVTMSSSLTVATGISLGASATAPSSGVLFISRSSGANVTLQTAGVTDGQLRVTATNTIAIADSGGNAAFAVNTSTGVASFGAGGFLRASLLSALPSNDDNSYFSITSGTGSGEFATLGHQYFVARSSAARDIVFWTGSTTPVERLRISSTGAVSMGGNLTANSFRPSAVQGYVGNTASGSYSQWNYNGTATGYIGTANQAISAGSTADFGITSGVGALIFGQNTAERFRLSTSGNLLIGSASDNGYRLQVTGTAHATAGVDTGTSSWDQASPGSSLVVGRSGASALTNTTCAFVGWLDSTHPLNGSGVNGELGLISRPIAGVSFVTNNLIRGRISTAGTWTINAATSANSLIVAGASGQYCAVFNGNGTTGSSFGPNINAGSNSSDQSLVVADKAGTAVYLTVRGDGSLALMGTGSYGGGAKVIFIANAATDPTTNPTGGGILYCSGGALKYRGSSGTVTTLGVA